MQILKFQNQEDFLKENLFLVRFLRQPCVNFAWQPKTRYDAQL